MFQEMYHKLLDTLLQGKVKTNIFTQKLKESFNPGRSPQSYIYGNRNYFNSR